MVHHVYTGRRQGAGFLAVVYCDGVPFFHLDSLKVCNHSPTGFEWGYGGSGPAQLALALLLEVCSEETAVELHQGFKWEVVAKLPHESWRLTTRQLVAWVMQNCDDTHSLLPSARE